MIRVKAFGYEGVCNGLIHRLSVNPRVTGSIGYEKYCLAVGCPIHGTFRALTQRKMPWPENVRSTLGQISQERSLFSGRFQEIELLAVRRFPHAAQSEARPIRRRS